MSLLEQLFITGHIVDIILVFIILEGLFLYFYYRQKGTALSVTKFAIHTLPGVFIFLALRCVLVGSGWHWPALLLLASLVAHIIDWLYISTHTISKN